MRSACVGLGRPPNALQERAQAPQHILVGEPKMLGEAGRTAASGQGRRSCGIQPSHGRAHNCTAEPVLGPHLRAKPAQVIVGQGEVGDQVFVGDLVRPATQPRELSVGQESNRHEARYPRRSTRYKTGYLNCRRPPARGSSRETVPDVVVGDEPPDLVQLDLGLIGSGRHGTGNPPVRARQAGRQIGANSRPEPLVTAWPG